MALARPLKTNFTAGEISPLMRARSELMQCGGADTLAPQLERACLVQAATARALLVDALEVAGIETATLSQASRAHIAPLLPQANREIPIDFGTIIAQTSPDAVYGDEAGTLIGRVMEDDGVGAGVVMLTSQPAMDVVARAVVRVGAMTRKPLVFVHAAGSTGHAAREVLRDAGYGYLESQNDALRIMGALRDAAGAALCDPSHTPSPDHRTAADTPSGFLNEVQARQLIESYGLPTTQWRHAHDVDGVVRALAHFPGKVAIKAVSPTLVHKSDIGAVRLGIASDEEARQACAAIAAAVRDAGHELDGFLVTAMVRPDAELILGVQRDPAFGPMVMSGAGGVLVELLRDVQMAPAPVTRAQALAKSLDVLEIVGFADAFERRQRRRHRRGLEPV